MLIADILESNPLGVLLFTRPRRFGKSLNLSMIDAFFNIEYEGNTWFDGLEISGHREYDAYRNAYPVIYVDFKELDTGSGCTLSEIARAYMSELYNDYHYLSESDKLTPEEREDFASVCGHRSDDAHVVRALSDLAKYLRKHFEKKAIVLIDEYDKPMNDAYGTEMSSEVRGFMRSMLASVLKGNRNVEFAVLTGVMQIAKESIFSGLNNLKVDNVLSDRYGERYGFTNGEVERMCADFGHPEKYDEAKEWYDGYCFGSADIYNPWSVLNYVDSGFKPAAYWAGTSGNDIIPRLLDFADDGVKSDLSEIARGGSVPASIDASVAYGDLTSSKGSFYSVMVMAGYLKAAVNGTDGDAMLSMPNREVRDVFGKAIISRYTGGGEAVRFLNGMLENNVEKMSGSLREMLTGSVSSRVLGSEHSYQAFLLGATMYLGDRYRITGDFESGNGFHDLRMERVKGDALNVVIEVKMTHKGKEGPDALAKMALEQIHDRGYAHGLRGRTILYGIAFDGKKLVIKSEKLDL